MKVRWTEHFIFPDLLFPDLLSICSFSDVCDFQFLWKVTLYSFTRANRVKSITFVNNHNSTDTTSDTTLWKIFKPEKYEYDGKTDCIPADRSIRNCPRWMILNLNMHVNHHYGPMIEFHEIFRYFIFVCAFEHTHDFPLQSWSWWIFSKSD